MTFVTINFGTQSKNPANGQVGRVTGSVTYPPTEYYVILLSGSRRGEMIQVPERFLQPAPTRDQWPA